MLAIKGSSAADEVTTARGQLQKAHLDAQVLTVRAHDDADPTYVVKVRRAG